MNLYGYFRRGCGQTEGQMNVYRLCLRQLNPFLFLLLYFCRRFCTIGNNIICQNVSLSVTKVSSTWKR